jgi:serine protease AprX
MRRKRISTIGRLLFLGSLLMVSAASSSWADIVEPRVQSALGSLGPNDKLSVIITFSNRVDPSQFQGTHRGTRRAKMIRALKARSADSQRSLRALLKQHKVTQVKSLWLINGIEVTVGREVIQKLANLAGVQNIKLNQTLYIPAELPSPTALPEWNLRTIHADELWSLGYNGQGIVVATMDSGVDADHADLKSRWRGGTNSWFDPNGEHEMPADLNGHGTAVMSVILGGDAGGTSIGVAPSAKWISVKIFDDSGVSDLAKIHEGFQWLLDPDGNRLILCCPSCIGSHGSLGECLSGCNQN